MWLCACLWILPRNCFRLSGIRKTHMYCIYSSTHTHTYFIFFFVFPTFQSLSIDNSNSVHFLSLTLACSLVLSITYPPAPSFLLLRTIQYIIHHRSYIAIHYIYWMLILKSFSMWMRATQERRWEAKLLITIGVIYVCYFRFHSNFFSPTICLRRVDSSLIWHE